MTRFAIGIPARDEEELLPRCLLALTAAADRLHAHVPGAEVSVVVGLDRCTDATPQVVESAAGIEALHVSGIVLDAGSAGIARQAACSAAAARARELTADPHRVWVATTDADTVVPDNWFLAQHLARLSGYDLFVGTAQPDPDDHEAGVLADFLLRHTFDEGHPHVHGASLGLSLAAFEALCGFAALRVGEDQDLVDRAHAAGMEVLASDAARVTTSGRLVSRLEGGFATYLAALHR